MFKNTVKLTTVDLFEFMKDREAPYEPMDGTMILEAIDIYDHLIKQDVDGYIDYLSEIENDDDDYGKAQVLIDDLIRIREYDNEFQTNEIYWAVEGRYELWTNTTLLNDGSAGIYYRIMDTENDQWIIPDQYHPEKGIKSETYNALCGEAIDIKIGNKIYTFSSDMRSQG